MAVYAYKAIDAGHTVVQGTIAADAPHQAREELRARGLIVQEINDHETPSQRYSWLKRGPKQYAARLATSMRELATLLRVGIPMLDALKTVSQQQRGHFQAALILLRDRVTAGIGLAEAMAEQPEVFEPLCVHMVEVGENAGTLEAVIDQWADFKERSLALKDRVTTALLYPVFVLVVGLCVTIFLMTFVMPMLLDNLLEAGKELPWPTQVAKWVSDMLIHYGWFLGLLIVAFVILLINALKTQRGKRVWHTVLLRIPLIGPMARQQGIARIAALMATLLKSGIQFLRAIDVTARSTDNLILRDALQQVSVDVGAGVEIGRALERTSAFPPMVVQIFMVGQDSGQLEDMLERLAADYNRQVARMADRLTAVLEPILIIVLATLVGFILFATVLPILEAGNVMS